MLEERNRSRELPAAATGCSSSCLASCLARHTASGKCFHCQAQRLLFRSVPSYLSTRPCKKVALARHLCHEFRVQKGQWAVEVATQRTFLTRLAGKIRHRKHGTISIVHNREGFSAKSSLRTAAPNSYVLNLSNCYFGKCELKCSEVISRYRIIIIFA